jgi:hypothetical protein
MKEFMRILVEQTAIGLGQGDLMTWFYVGLFTLTSMKLANLAGRRLANRLSVGDMADVE